MDCESGDWIREDATVVYLQVSLQQPLKVAVFTNQY
jgi:hypothetical protein